GNARTGDAGQAVQETAPGEAPVAATDKVGVEAPPKRKTHRARTKTAKAKPDKGKTAPAARKPAARTRKRPARKAADGKGESGPEQAATAAKAANMDGDGDIVRSGGGDEPKKKSASAEPAGAPEPAAPQVPVTGSDDAGARQSGEDPAARKSGWWQRRA
ncbi:MAG: hypothetical protein ACE5FM_09760, partial [Methyloligellaceae bacterium]